MITDQKRKDKVVAMWLLIGVAMIIIQILLGGITRLTGSGLSITEWKPIMGSVPPMGESQWQEAFSKYQQIAQYKYVNNHFTLSDFKFIFFWEWFHRLWARSLGVVFAIPFIYFIIKKYFSKEMILPLVILFILGGLQGLIGWLMVHSGLNDTNLYVSHIRLAIHFVSALVLLCYTLWFALKLLIPQHDIVVDKKLNHFIKLNIVVLGVQLTYGAFMAGLHAATSAHTWPTINGEWLPATLAKVSWLNHPINVQFVHRGLAYLLVVLLVMLYFKIIKTLKSHPSNALKKVAVYPLVLIIVQATLGVLTVMSALKIVPGHFGIYEALAQLHQLVAMTLLMVLVIQLFIVKAKSISI